MANCPRCRGSMEFNDLRCAHCGYDFPPMRHGSSLSPKRNWLSAGRGWIPALVLGFAAMYLTTPPFSVDGRPSLEFDAVDSCRSYVDAQVAFKRYDWDGDGKLAYAPSFPLLNTTRDGNDQVLNLIDSAFAAATAPETARRGYVFRDVATIAGRPVDCQKDFALCATPAHYGPAERHTFIVSTDGRIYGKDLKAAEFVVDFPADPARQGWRPGGDCPSRGPFLFRHRYSVWLASGPVVFLAVWIGIAVYARRRDRRQEAEAREAE